MVLFIGAKGGGSSFFEIIGEVTFVGKAKFVGDLPEGKTGCNAAFNEFYPVVVNVFSERDAIVVFKVLAEVVLRDVEGLGQLFYLDLFWFIDVLVNEGYQSLFVIVPAIGCIQVSPLLLEEGEE